MVRSKFSDDLKRAYQGFNLDIPALNATPGEWALPGCRDSTSPPAMARLSMRTRMSITATVPILMMSYKSLPRRPLRHERDQPSPKERHIDILRHLFRFGASLLRIDISPRSLALGQRQQNAHQAALIVRSKWCNEQWPVPQSRAAQRALRRAQRLPRGFKARAYSRPLQ